VVGGGEGLMASNPYFEALENWAEGVPGFLFY
jgi:hypothetical protein